MIAAHRHNYDAVIYFCGPKTIGPPRRLKAAERNPRPIVRPLPVGGAASVEHLAHAAGDAERPQTRSPLEPHGREAIELVAEQGAIPLDQPARFLAIDESQARELAGQPHSDGYLSWAEPLVGDRPWLALSAPGRRGVTGRASPVLLRALPPGAVEPPRV